jgi:anhydro-N-acetylmuramic acid kinase
LADRLMTAIHCTAWAVAKDIPGGSRVLVTGGGAHNPVLMARLRQEGEARGISFHVPEQFVVDGKEALAFALLGLQRALDLPNAEGSWTGASSPSVGGALWGTFPAAGRRRD